MTISVGEPSLSSSSLIPSIKEITEDPDAENILKKMFTSESVCRIWTHINKQATNPMRVVAMSQEECQSKGVLFGTARCESHFVNGKLYRHSLYYNKGLKEQDAVVCLIVEMMNAFFAHENRNLMDTAPLYTEKQYAVVKEKIEWIALCHAGAIVDEFYPGTAKEHPFYDDFDEYLEIQQHNGHTAFYEQQHQKLMAERARVQRSRRKPGSYDKPPWNP